MLRRSRMIAVGLLITGAFAMLPTLVMAEDNPPTTDQGQAQPGQEMQMGSLPKGKDFSSEEIKKQLKQLEESMGPMMEILFEQMMKGMAKALAAREVAEYYATFTRSYYDALITRGFTEEQAMQIITSTGIPSLGGRK